MDPQHEDHDELELEELELEPPTAQQDLHATRDEKRAGEQEEVQRAIEAAFAKADRSNVRDVTREIERLIRRLDDKALRARYESAVDLLPDMVKHAGSDDD